MSDVFRSTSAVARLLALWAGGRTRDGLRRLNEGEAWSPRREGRLQVCSGRVWVTFLGDSRDYVLGAGTSLVLGEKHNAVVQALGGPAVVIAKES